MTNEELEQEVKRLEEQITNLKIKILESKAEKKAYEVEVPEDVEDYYYVDETGLIERLWAYDINEQIEVFKRGLAFKTKEEAEQYDKERILIKKLKDWAEKYNVGWTVNWEESEDKFYIDYHHASKCFQVKIAWHANTFHKLPYFKSEKIGQQFIEEFVEEIKEVLC